MNKHLSLVKKRQEVYFRVHIQPLNENQDLNYSESFSGTPSEIVKKSREIIRDLSKVLTQGTFTVKIEDFSFSECVIITDEAILDGNYNPINIFEEALK